MSKLQGQAGRLPYFCANLVHGPNAAPEPWFAGELEQHPTAERQLAHHVEPPRSISTLVGRAEGPKDNSPGQSESASDALGQPFTKIPQP
jgi:hypothetical protein